MKKLVFLVLSLMLITITVSAQKTVKTYQSAYIINTETIKRIAIEQQLNNKSVSVQIFLLDYPILEDLDEFNSKEKYSLINDSLITSVAESNNGKFIYFYLKNKQVYKVKNKKRINKII